MVLIEAIVTLNQGQVGNAGRNFALENINIVGGNLAELKVEKAVLLKINLLDVQLYKFKLSAADLYQADFRGTHLYQADLNGMVLTYTLPAPG